MSIDELIQLLESYFQSGLDSLQEEILRCCWQGKSYQGIAAETYYEEEQIKTVASKLWQILSNIKKQPIDESNFRSLFDLNLSQIQQGSANKKSIQFTSEFPNGPVPIDSNLYISRPPVEELAYAEIAQPGSFICVKAPRKMGKTSLNLRILARAVSLGYKNVNLDFQQADKALFTSLDKFLRWFCANVSRELGLEARLDDYWDEEMGSKVSCSLYFEAHLLSSLDAVVIVLNEVDLVFEHPEIAADFLPLLRSWYEQAKRVDIWQKLRLVLTYSTEIIVPLKLSQSPFNVGLPLRLSPFTKKQVQDLVQHHDLTWMDERNIDRLMEMVGGHPYLVRLALYHLALDGDEAQSLELLLEQAPTEAGIYNSHLRQYVSILQEDLPLLSVFCELIGADSPRKFDPLVSYKLQSMGLIKLDGDYASVACELYRLYFRRQLCDANDSLEELGLNANLDLDPLTQLITRHAFESCLQELWRNCINRKGELSLILCDIDYFKLYNKTYGNATGDNCLQQLANAIRECLSSLNIANQNQALIARYGGDKFGVLLSENEIIALAIAQNIKEKIQALAISCQYPGIGGLPAEVITVSVAVASIIPCNEIEPTSLMEIAEQALYQAKRKGRNQVVAAQK